MENCTDLGLSIKLLQESFKTWYRVSQNKIATCSQYQKMIQSQENSNDIEWQLEFPFHFELLHNGKSSSNTTLIGKGAYAEVYETNNVAYKTIKIGDRSHLRCNLKELVFMHVIQHPRLLHPYCSQLSMKNGSFYKYIHALPLAKCSLFDAMSKGMVEHLSQILNIMYQIGDGLHYMHKNKVYHGDIKPHNILYRDKDDWVIADFTLTSFSNRNSEQSFGSLNWRSPEACSGVSSGEASDVWSWAMVFLDLLAGKNKSFSETVLQVKDNEHLLTKYSHMLGEPNYMFKMTTAPADAIFEEQNDFWDKVEWNIPLNNIQKHEVISFMKRIMNWDCVKRPTMIEVLQDPFWEVFEYKGVVTELIQNTISVSLSQSMSIYMEDCIKDHNVNNSMRYDITYTFTQMEQTLDKIKILYTEKELMTIVCKFFKFVWFNDDKYVYYNDTSFDAVCFHILHALDYNVFTLDYIIKKDGQ